MTGQHDDWQKAIWRRRGVPEKVEKFNAGHRFHLPFRDQDICILFFDQRKGFIGVSGNLNVCRAKIAQGISHHLDRQFIVVDDEKTDPAEVNLLFNKPVSR